METIQHLGFYFLSAVIVAVTVGLLSSCDPDVPELTESSRQKLVGSWQLEKETVTNGDGFGGVFTREGENLWAYVNYEFKIEKVTITNIPNYSNVAEYLGIEPSVAFQYTLQQQKDGTWLLTIIDLFDKARNLEGGYSPITIHKLTNKTIEWEYESYGGDEGPVVYYQYLRRL